MPYRIAGEAKKQEDHIRVEGQSGEAGNKADEDPRQYEQDGIRKPKLIGDGG